jgi:AraC-like DNA-binding protein
MNSHSTSSYENDDPIYSAHHHAALLIDLVQGRSSHKVNRQNSHNINSHKLLSGTGLFYEDVVSGEKNISSQQFLRLIKNAQHEYKHNDLSFRWGHTLWPGHYDCFSQLLGNCQNLYQTLQVLSEYRLKLSPLMTPIITQDSRYCYIQWRDAIGLGEQRKFIIESWMTGFAALCRFRSKQKLPWHFGFSHSQPKHKEQYQVNLGEQVYFDLGIDVMAIDKAYLHQNWQHETSTAYNIALRQCQKTSTARIGFIEQVFDYLQSNVRQSLTLEDVATHFKMSSATFKRKLKKHNSRFQQLQDQARLSTALYLYQCNGFNNSQVARYLNFNDMPNYRRAFKRWSGRTPNNLKQDLLMPAISPV